MLKRAGLELRVGIGKAEKPKRGNAEKISLSSIFRFPFQLSVVSFSVFRFSAFRYEPNIGRTSGSNEAVRFCNRPALRQATDAPAGGTGTWETTAAI
jgi:hypothetical protein